jgi:Flp pilus assembly protein TadD
MDTHAWILFRMGRLEEARQLMRQAVALDGQKSPELLLHYGDILHALGEQFMAETYWKKALEKGADKTKIEERMKCPKVEKPTPKADKKE